MRSDRLLWFAKAGYALLSAFCCALGIFVIAKPALSPIFVHIIAGCVLIALGIVKLMGYFSRDLYQLAFQHDLAFGILLMAAGSRILFIPKQDLNILCIVLGIVILADGLFKIQTAFDARRFGIRIWWLILLFAACAGIVGGLLAFHPGGARDRMVLSGLALMFEGILGICVACGALKIRRRPAVQRGNKYVDQTITR